MLNKIATGLAPALLGLGAIALAAGTGQATSGETQASCEIQATRSGGMTALKGVVHADDAVAGTYRFRVESTGRSGNSNIQQGGGFSAEAGSTVTLGQVMLSGPGAVYDASLTIEADGATIACEERVGGAI